MTTSQIFLGIGLIISLAVGCQIIAARFGLPAIILLLPVGFGAGNLTTAVDPAKIFGAGFSPLVSLAVAIILFDGGLDLVSSNLKGDDRRVVHRLRRLGIPITWAGAALLAWPLLGLSWRTAVMLGAILIVSGPTVVTPLLAAARPGPRLTRILGYEGTTVDPVGAIIAVVVFHALQANNGHGAVDTVFGFIGRLGIGLVGGAVGIAVLWLLLKKLKLSGLLATEAILATVVTVAAFCDALSDDTGLIAAITMGIVLANLPGVPVREDRPLLKTVVQLTIGMLFISISATVTPASLHRVVWPTVGLVAGLVLVIRPIVAVLSTMRTDLTRKERVFVGCMDPRGIVAASTASTFSAPLIALGLIGADKLLPATFLVIVGTVAIYGFAAAPLAKRLGLADPEPDPDPAPAATPANDPP
jgi:NhaP-type Na+/H+ or K+/H+ antiporter